MIYIQCANNISDNICILRQIFWNNRNKIFERPRTTNWTLHTYWSPATVNKYFVTSFSLSNGASTPPTLSDNLVDICALWFSKGPCMLDIIVPPSASGIPIFVCLWYLNVNQRSKPTFVAATRRWLFFNTINLISYGATDKFQWSQPPNDKVPLPAKNVPTARISLPC